MEDFWLHYWGKDLIVWFVTRKWKKKPWRWKQETADRTAKSEDVSVREVMKTQPVKKTLFQVHAEQVLGSEVSFPSLSAAVVSVHLSSGPHHQSRKRASYQTPQSCTARCLWQTDWGNTDTPTRVSVFATQRHISALTSRSWVVSLHHSQSSQ